MQNVKHWIVMIVVMAIVTYLIRLFPFVIFPENKKTPRFVKYLGVMIPAAAMGLLVIYSFKDAIAVDNSLLLPQLLAGVFTIAIHLWKKNTLLSIGVGTISYMVLIQFVFK